MTALREAALLALDALENHAMQKTYAGGIQISNAAIALREALAQPAQEPVPVAWMDREGDLYKMPEIEGWASPHTLLYTHPPKRQPLTEEEIKQRFDQWEIIYGGYTIDFVRAIERAHGIGEEE